MSKAFKELEATVQQYTSGIASKTPTIEQIPKSFTEIFHSLSQVETQPLQSINLPMLPTTTRVQHRAKLYENTAMANLLNSIESIRRFRASQFDMVKACLKAEGDVVSVNMVFLKASTPSSTGFVMNLQSSEAEASFGIRVPPTYNQELLETNIAEEWAPITRNMTIEFKQKVSVFDNWGKPALTAAMSINPHHHIEALQDRASRETGSAFDDTYREILGVVINAVDNVNARTNSSYPVRLKWKTATSSWEKTMAGHSPQQGLMHASSKKTAVPLDGNNIARELGWEIVLKWAANNGNRCHEKGGQCGYDQNISREFKWCLILGMAIPGGIIVVVARIIFWHQDKPTLCSLLLLSIIHTDGPSNSAIDEQKTCCSFGTLLDKFVDSWNGLQEFTNTVCQMRHFDLRKIVFAAEMGLALMLIFLLISLKASHKSVNRYSVWATLTVVIVFRFSIWVTLSKGLNRGLGTLSAGGFALGMTTVSTREIEKML